MPFRRDRLRAIRIVSCRLRRGAGEQKLSEVPKVLRERGDLPGDVAFVAFVTGKATKAEGETEIFDEEETMALVEEFAIHTFIGNRNLVRFTTAHIGFVEVIRRDDHVAIIVIIIAFELFGVSECIFDRPSITVPGSAYLFLHLSALECLNSFADDMTYYALC